MSELEPTRTYSNPTATEVLRRMLDERDEYYKTSGNKTWWGRPIDRQTGKPINVFHYQAQPMGEDRLSVELQLATPEQAIAATLGPAARHPKPHEKWTTVLLPEIAWSWDDSWPDYLSVAHNAHGEWRTYVPEARLLEAMDAAREAGRRADMAERVAADHKGLCDSLRETNDDLRRIIDEMRSATLGAGTCKRVMDSIDPFAMWVCDHCGHPLDTSENFCGGCGRKVVDE